MASAGWLAGCCRIAVRRALCVPSGPAGLHIGACPTPSGCVQSAGRAARQAVFSSEASGKPVLVNAPSKPKIYFSHSRSRNLVACAVTCVGPVGIDVEAVNASIADLRLLDRFVALPDQRMCQVIKLACRVIRQPRSFFTGLCWRRTGNPGAVGCHLPIPALASNQAAADGLR